MGSDSGYQSLASDLEEPGQLSFVSIEEENDCGGELRRGFDVVHTKVRPYYRTILITLVVGMAAVNVALVILCKQSVSEEQGNDAIPALPYSMDYNADSWKPFECGRVPKTGTPLAEKVVLVDRKGLAVDDTTWDACPGSIPVSWPATAGGAGNRVINVRLFRTGSNYSANGENVKMLKKFLEYNSAKALVGTPISCNQTDDDAEWLGTVEALRILGPEHVMGVAIGNELDLYDRHPESWKCYGDLWGYFKRNFQQRVESLQHVHGGAFANISVTTVTAGSIMKCGDHSCSPPKMTIIPEFVDVLQFIYKIMPADKFVLSMNFYPYFQPCPPLKRDGITPAYSCSEWLRLASCVDSEKCVVRQSLIAARLALESVLGERGRNTRLWLGELGWSSPQSSTLSTGACSPFKSGAPRQICPQWSSQESLVASYNGFLQWNLSVREDMPPVEYAFWFSVRDSANFRFPEHFGLCGPAAAAAAASLWSFGPPACQNDFSRV